MKISKSSGKYNTTYHNDSYLLLFGKLNFKILGFQVNKPSEIDVSLC